MEKRDTERSLVSEIPDDLLAEIISRVPYKSTLCCKCVCRCWHDLVSHPDHRKKLPWSTLAGFFYNGNRKLDVDWHYRSVSGNYWCPRVDGTLSFLPKCDKLCSIDMLDSSNGLLLLRRWERKGTDTRILLLDYMVCNPATETWVAVPATGWSGYKVPHARLGFDPSVSSHFHVFEFVHECTWKADKGYHSWCIKSVRIYSSQTGAWTHPSPWNRRITDFDSTSRSAFHNGLLYVPYCDDLVIAAVDVEGNCRLIRFPTPHARHADVYLSRVQLYLANYGGSELSIWALEDSSSTENWILKHNISHLQLFEEMYSPFEPYFRIIIHPEHTTMIFIMVCYPKLLGCHQSVTKLMSYELDSRELCFICDLPRGRTPSYLPYVPLFSESLVDGH